MHEKRIAFRKTNEHFEFNRKAFYRKLNNEEQPECAQTTEEKENFWKKIWKADEKSSEID